MAGHELTGPIDRLEFNEAQRASLRKATFSLRLQGMTYAEIGATLKIGMTTAFKWVKETVKHMESEDREALRRLELSRMDYYLLRLEPILRCDDPELRIKAIKESMRISESRRKLLALDALEAAQTEETKVRTEAEEALAKLLTAKRTENREIPQHDRRRGVHRGMTPEQRAANEKLNQAIIEANRAFGFDEGFLVTDWLVLTAETRFDDDGHMQSCYGRLYRDGCMPLHRILGLIDVHRNYVVGGIYRDVNEETE